MEYLQVPNWDKWQTYRKDRGTPPWIKIHRKLMTNPEWAMLSDSEKGALISIWLIAHAPTVRKIALLDDEPDLNKFMDLGFLAQSGCQDDNQMASCAQPNDAPETETETEYISADLAHFDLFWEIYPRKLDKKRAEAKWKNLKSDERDSAIADVSKRNLLGSSWGRDSLEFVPYAKTYLHGRNWSYEGQ